jgi:phosphatidylserine decarboxylase
MAASNYPYFSRPGWIPFVVSAGLAATVWNNLGFFWSLPLWLFCVALIFLFRDPVREIPAIPLAVVSPADGLISKVDTVPDPYLGRVSRRIVIDMFPIGVFSTRSPIEGKVMDTKNCSITDGKQYPHGVWLQTDEKDDVIMVMDKGRLNSKPRCYIRIGEKVGQGQRCGFIRLGGKVEVYLPIASRIGVEQGAKVLAGSDVIATLVHK